MIIWHSEQGIQGSSETGENMCDENMCKIMEDMRNEAVEKATLEHLKNLTGLLQSRGRKNLVPPHLKAFPAFLISKRESCQRNTFISI